jgi:hypothetical protein
MTGGQETVAKLSKKLKMSFDHFFIVWASSDPDLSPGGRHRGFSAQSPSSRASGRLGRIRCADRL